MKVNGKWYQTIWQKPNDDCIMQTIDQRMLPHQFVIIDLKTVEEFIFAIKEMQVRGAILIGVTAAWGMHCAAQEASSAISETEFIKMVLKSGGELKAARPTAVNLAHAVDKVIEALTPGKTILDKIRLAKKAAQDITYIETDKCLQIGKFGLKLIQELSQKKKGQPVNILTHCNAGWLACVDYGTATAPIYAAFDAKVPIHIWVDETRPWNQGARLTAWELGEYGVPHTVISDNMGGHLMQHGQVDMVIVGSDRTTRTGDVANKIGTYLKALAAHDNHIPFYVALPSSSIDWDICDGIKEIPIEERDPNEVKYLSGFYQGGWVRLLLVPEKSQARNDSFDVTPSRLITGLITERGICAAQEKALINLFPESQA